MAANDPGTYRPRSGRIWLAVILTAVLIAAGLLGGLWFWDHIMRTAGLTQVKVLLLDQERAWNAGDLDGFMAGYHMTDDITFFSEGTVQAGWVGLRDRYEKKYRAGGQSMGTLTFSDLVIDVPSVDMAVARGRWKVEWEDRSANGLFTILLRKFPEGWRIVHDHTSAAKEKD